MTDPIFITGCPRSGITLTAAIINGCGAFGGVYSPRSSSKRDNPSFENMEIRDRVSTPYAQMNGIRPASERIFSCAGRPLLSFPGLREHVEYYIRRDGYVDGPWFYKDHQLCLMWRAWHAAFPDATWIVVRRTNIDIVNSCMKTGFMDMFVESSDWHRWVDLHLGAIEDMKRQADMNVQEVWPSRFIAGDFDEIAQVVTNAGLQWGCKE